jgi:hypothetical protein
MDQQKENNNFLSKWEARLVNPKGDPGFTDVWPSESKGNGKMRLNNLRTGGAQGKGTLLRKAACLRCGFINDLNLIDHTGGSIDGKGGYGDVTTATATFPVSGPPDVLGNFATGTENYGDQTIGKGSGCALCGSKNSTQIRTILDYVWPTNSPANLGF